MNDAMDYLRGLADSGDVHACIYLGDLLLQRVPPEPPPESEWDSIPEIKELTREMDLLDSLANDAYDAHTMDAYKIYAQQAKEVNEKIKNHKETLRRDTRTREDHLREAFHWFSHAAMTLEDPAGIYRLAWRYFPGEGTAMDPDSAIHWWKQAASLGSQEAAEKLAELGELF